jgi:hypothetical protein
MPDLTDELFATAPMAAVFSAEEHVRQMLRFEAALASMSPRSIARLRWPARWPSH